MDKKAKQIVMKTFLSSSGWKDTRTLFRGKISNTKKRKFKKPPFDHEAMQEEIRIESCIHSRSPMLV
ncbi:hypothetical protein M5W98_11430 [Paenibacillus apiarius]|nr:hypothetical protein [Paenibacillus apiarius]